MPVLIARLLAMTYNIHREKDAPAMTEDDVLPRLFELSARAPADAAAEPAVPASTGADLFSFLEEVRG